MNQAQHFPIYALLCLLTAPQFASAATPGWCQKHETTIFNCQFANQKVASVCADTKLSQQSGYLQYRFGKLNTELPELTYPKETAQAATHFKVGHYLFASATASWLSFDNAGFRYVLKTTLGRDVHEHVLGVYQNTKLVARMECKKTSVDLSQHEELLRKVLRNDEHDEVDL